MMLYWQLIMYVISIKEIRIHEISNPNYSSKTQQL